MMMRRYKTKSFLFQMNFKKIKKKKKKKDLGNLKYFLGIKVVRYKHSIFISQRKYVLDFLKETGMLECKAIDNAVEVKFNLAENSESPMVE
jgi:hypothetical protein